MMGLDPGNSLNSDKHMELRLEGIRNKIVGKLTKDVLCRVEITLMRIIIS